MKCLQVHGQQAAPVASAAAQGGTFTTFDVPGAVAYNEFGINPPGAIAGSYYDGITFHGFLRTSGGTITTFVAPGSGCSLSAFKLCSIPFGINPAGTITGYYSDASNVFHGFLRTSDGTFTTFDPPGSVNTIPNAINPAGAITGWYDDANGQHGFLRSGDGHSPRLIPQVPAPVP